MQAKPVDPTSANPTPDDLRIATANGQWDKVCGILYKLSFLRDENYRDHMLIGYGHFLQAQASLWQGSHKKLAQQFSSRADACRAWGQRRVDKDGSISANIQTFIQTFIQSFNHGKSTRAKKIEQFHSLLKTDQIVMLCYLLHDDSFIFTADVHDILLMAFATHTYQSHLLFHPSVRLTRFLEAVNAVKAMKIRTPFERLYITQALIALTDEPVELPGKKIDALRTALDEAFGFCDRLIKFTLQDPDINHARQRALFEQLTTAGTDLQARWQYLKRLQVLSLKAEKYNLYCHYNPASEDKLALRQEYAFSHQINAPKNEENAKKRELTAREIALEQDKVEEAKELLTLTDKEISFYIAVAKQIGWVPRKLRQWVHQHLELLGGKVPPSAAMISKLSMAINVTVMVIRDDTLFPQGEIQNMPGDTVYLGYCAALGLYHVLKPRQGMVVDVNTIARAPVPMAIAIDSPPPSPVASSPLANKIANADGAASSSPLLPPSPLAALPKSKIPEFSCEELFTKIALLLEKEKPPLGEGISLMLHCKYYVDLLIKNNSFDKACEVGAWSYRICHGLRVIQKQMVTIDGKAVSIQSLWADIVPDMRTAKIHERKSNADRLLPMSASAGSSARLFSAPPSRLAASAAANSSKISALPAISKRF